MTKIIAFSGRKKSGKTTASNFIYGLYLAGTSRFKDIGLANNGLIEVLKNDDTLHIVDLQKYYLGIGDIDEEIMDTINFLTPTIKVYSFADPLKNDICINIFGMTYDQCYDEDGKNSLTNITWESMPNSNKTGYMTGREVMEYFGTSIIRKIKQDAWSSATITKIKRDNPKVAIINDCRFPDEVRPIQENNGVVIRLSRNPDNSDSIPECALDPQNFNWDQFNYVIDNKDMTINEQCDYLYPIIVKEVQ